MDVVDQGVAVEALEQLAVTQHKVVLTLEMHVLDQPKNVVVLVEMAYKIITVLGLMFFMEAEEVVVPIRTKVVLKKRIALILIRWVDLAVEDSEHMP